MRNCALCGAVFGPAERQNKCLTCAQTPVWRLADQAVSVLEEAELPLKHWDIRRLIEGEHGYVHPGSLLVALAGDSRVCWGGKGIYGLYRHGLLPRLRDLGTVAAVYLYAAGISLHYRDIWFVLQYSGYKANPESVYYALRRVAHDRLVERVGQGDWRSPNPEVPASRIASLLGANSVDTREVLLRAGEQWRAGLVELERRVDRRPPLGPAEDPSLSGPG